MQTRTALCLMFLVVSSHCQEPACSKFDYDKNLLEMLVRLEFEMKQRDEARLMMKERLDKEETHRKKLEEQLTVTKSEAQELRKMVDFLNQTVRATSDWRAKVDEQLKQPDALNFNFFFDALHGSLTSGKACYKNIRLSHTDWYDTTTCVLTIKDAGLYHVTYTFITTSDTVSPYCDLHINNARLIHNRGKGTYQSTTAGMYVQLNKGDKLDIRCPHGWSNIYKGMGTIFTGALINSVN